MSRRQSTGVGCLWLRRAIARAKSRVTREEIELAANEIEREEKRKKKRKGKRKK